MEHEEQQLRQEEEVEEGDISRSERHLRTQATVASLLLNSDRKLQETRVRCLRRATSRCRQRKDIISL